MEEVTIHQVELGYHGNGNNVTQQWMKFTHNSGAYISTFNQIDVASGEENMEMGQDWGYMLGNYSGGGGSGSDNSGDQNNPGPATQPSQNPGVSNITNYGNAGGAYSPHTNSYGGGGGGGAGGVGETARNSTNFPDGSDGAHGGDGQPFSNFPAPVLAPAIPAPVRSDWTTAVGPTGLFGGGGSSAYDNAHGPGSTARSPGGGGGGYWNATPDPIANGIANTGGGGGSRGPSPISLPSGAGGSGILIIRYAL